MTTFGIQKRKNNNHLIWFSDLGIFFKKNTKKLCRFLSTGSQLPVVESWLFQVWNDSVHSLPADETQQRFEIRIHPDCYPGNRIYLRHQADWPQHQDHMVQDPQVPLGTVAVWLKKFPTVRSKSRFTTKVSNHSVSRCLSFPFWSIYVKMKNESPSAAFHEFCSQKKVKNTCLSLATPIYLEHLLLPKAVLPKMNQLWHTSKQITLIEPAWIWHAKSPSKRVYLNQLPNDEVMILVVLFTRRGPTSHILDKSESPMRKNIWCEEWTKLIWQDGV